MVIVSRRMGALRIVGRSFYETAGLRSVVLVESVLVVVVIVSRFEFVPFR